MYDNLENSGHDELVTKYAPLVKRIAYHLKARLPATVVVDDLLQAGMIGLLEASRKYDADQGASFETYAGIRIRGSMLDEVRKGDWAHRFCWQYSSFTVWASRPRRSIPPGCSPGGRACSLT